MTPMPVAVDVTRLTTRFGQPSPTGIDRVELAYARRYLRRGCEGFGLVSTALGPRVLDRETALDLVETIAAGWEEDTGAEDDPVYRGLASRPPQAPRSLETRKGGDASRARRGRAWMRVLRAGGVEGLPRGTAYLHVSHLRLERPERFDWLYDRPDIRAVFLLQDLIPIDFPEYCRPGEATRHAARLETAARHAARLAVSSADVGARIAGHLARRGLARPPLVLAPLGIEPAFSRRDGAAPALDRPTFLVCGTIEPRKNHLMLLNLWRRLAEIRGPDTPRLLLVGRRGWEAESAVAMLERCPGLRGPVEEVTGLTTPGLARLMRGASALLMPSFAEGYGLPLLEAAAAGLPVVASDTPVHREVAGAFAHLLGPDDGLGWLQAVEALAVPGSPLRADLARRLDGYAAPGWTDHFDRIDAALAEL